MENTFPPSVWSPEQRSATHQNPSPTETQARITRAGSQQAACTARRRFTCLNPRAWVWAVCVESAILQSLGQPQQASEPPAISTVMYPGVVSHRTMDQPSSGGRRPYWRPFLRATATTHLGAVASNDPSTAPWTAARTTQRAYRYMQWSQGNVHVADTTFGWRWGAVLGAVARAPGRAPPTAVRIGSVGGVVVRLHVACNAARWNGRRGGQLRW